MMAVRSEIHVLNDLSQWATAAATLTLELRRQGIEERKRFSLALSGGRTPGELYHRLATDSTQREWANTDFFFSDERCVPPDHPDSNFHLADQALFRPLNIPREHIHRMRGELRDVEAAAREYEELLRTVTKMGQGEWPRLDLVLLGVGNDGHTASLFPGTDALHERRRWVTVGHAPSGPPTRLTLTLGVINQATVVLFLASGESKAGIVKTILEPEQESNRQLPAALVQPERGRLIWVLDRAAAAKLTGQYTQSHPRSI
ncbi:MAG TPA: 6-phosphogluconolactonase [Nitrospira sp.]|nr:6-phosphogluconolactonase [Nitrospira sp.]